MSIYVPGAHDNLLEDAVEHTVRRRLEEGIRATARVRPQPVLGAVCPLLSTFGENCPRFLKNIFNIDF